MAAKTTTGNGTWATGASWVGGIPAGVGDTVTLAHDITVDADTTFGDSPAASGNILTVQTGKTLTVNTGVKISLRGGFLLEGTGKIVLGAGATLEFDPSNAAVPGTAAYRGMIGSTHGSSPGLICNGVPGNPASVNTKAGAATVAYAQLTDGTGPWTHSGLITAQYTNFSRLGDSVRPAIITSPGYGGTFSLNACNFDNCGQVSRTYNLGEESTWSMVNCKFTNSLAPENVTVSTGGALTTGVRKMWDNAFDKTLHLYPPEDFDIQRNYFARMLDTTNADWAVFSGNFVRQVDAVGTFIIAGDVEDNYFFYDEPGQYNPHFIEALKYGRNQTISGNIFDTSCNQPAQEGDCIMLSASPGVSCTAFILNNIIVRGPSDKTVGTLFSALGNANTFVVAEHNTYFTGFQGAAVGETYAGHAGMVVSFLSNIAVSKLGGEGYKLYDSGTNNSVPNLVSSEMANYNCGFGLLAGSNLKGYHNLEFSAGFPGDVDIDADPGLFDDTRRLITWSTNQGGAGTVADALSRIESNRALIQVLVDWVREGFEVTNPLLQNAGHDGVTIGAQPYRAAVTLTVSPDSLLADSTGNILTVTGVGTSWTAGTPGTPTFTIDGVTGAAITSQVINNATSATLTITAGTGGNIGTLTISDGTVDSNPISVTAQGVVPVAGEDEWWDIMREWAGYLTTWFQNTTDYDYRLSWNYYDGENSGFKLKLHFGGINEFDAFIQENWDTYTDGYVLLNNGAVAGWRNFTEGSLYDVFYPSARSADSLNAIGLQLLNGAYVATGDVSDSTLSRECAYALETHINAVRAGITLSAPQIARRDQLKAYAMGHIDQWIGGTAPYFRPFMGGLTAKALIDYYTYVAEDAQIIAKVRAMADYAWTTCWKSTGGAWGAGKSFLYTDRILPGGVEPMDGFTQPDLNMLIAPIWGWLYFKLQGPQYRTNGDQIFQGGVPVYDEWGFHVSGTSLGTRSASNPLGKQFNQQLYWGPKYFEWAEAPQASSFSVSPSTLVAGSTGNIVTATGVGTNWTPGTPGTPTFSIGGVTGAQITSQVVNSPTSATLTVTASSGVNTGVLLISDGATVANGVTVTPIVPPGGGGVGGGRRRPF